MLLICFVIGVLSVILGMLNMGDAVNSAQAKSNRSRITYLDFR